MPDNVKEIKINLSKINDKKLNGKIKLTGLSVLSRQTVVLLDVPSEWKEIQKDLNNKYGTSKYDWKPHISIGRGDIFGCNDKDIQSEYGIDFNLEIRKGCYII